MSLPLSIPVPPGHQDAPVWTGRAFGVGNTTARILSYDLGSSGWTDELTELHESAGDEQHYINLASHEHAVSRMERWMTAATPVIIDIGCSSGYTVRLLRARMPHATIIGADFCWAPLEKLGRAIPDLPLLHFDLVNCPLPDNSLDGVVLLNVLEHIMDDSAAIGHVTRILKPGGIAAIEVPAGPGLYGIYDKQLMHFRRYRMTDLVKKVLASGLDILERSHLGFFFYPAFWITKKWDKCYLGSSPETQKRIVAKNMHLAQHSPLMHSLMKLEARLRPRIYLPCGIRCLVTCRKPSVGPSSF